MKATLPRLGVNSRNDGESALIQSKINAKIKKENGSEWKRYLEWLSKRLGFTKLEDWYSLTPKDIQKYQTLKEKKLLSMLQTSFPDHIWNPTKFHYGWLLSDKLPDEYWKEKKNLRNLVDWLA